MGATGAGDTVIDLGGPDRTLVAANFPFVKNIDQVTQLPNGAVGPAAGNINDTVSSQGIHFTLFQGTTTAPKDRGTRLADPVFNVKGVTTRRVEPRNTPTMINAVLNFANFWDGRANPVFNGVNPFGLQDPNAAIFVVQKNGTVASTKVALENASLASQAVGPPLSPFEMSYGNPDANNARTYAELGKKLLRDDAGVLSRQLVDPKDSVLGALSAYPNKGLKVNYRTLLRQAFDPKLWNYKGLIVLKKTTVGKKASGLQPTVDCTFGVEAPVGTADPAPTKDGYFVQAEANFSLFVGLAIMMYESTLIADQTPYDQWMETGTLSTSFNADALAGLNLFVGKGHCSACHSGPELTGASVRNAQKGKNVIETMVNFRGPTLYDNGFYNIGVTPTTDDLGRGGQDLNGRPLAWSRQSLMSRVLNTSVPFPIIGDSTINALGEEGEIVCTDTNGNGFCDTSEPLNAGFKRASVDGSFKVPGLRNQELMAPYMHNGGFATLRQVVEFYNRGGNFCGTNQANLDPDIEPRSMTSDELDKLVSFLLSLTDQRVRLEQGPFDHPELYVPIPGTSEGTTADTQRLPQVGAGGVTAAKAQKPFLGLNPRDSIYTPTGVCSVTQ
jgi:cytochrome c peroxidase